MGDDVSQSLKDMAHIIDIAQGRAEVIMTSGSMLRDAHEEIERLRAMCDMLANRLRSGSDSGWDDAIDAWEDVREFGDKPESQGSAKLSPNQVDPN